VKIKLKVDLTGTRNGVDWPARGEEFEVPDEEGRELCASGIAEPVKEDPKTEKATAPKAETRGSH
jgi:hypothetical protein